ncbi:MAG: hypothetical protein ACYC4H_14255 [Desulfocucumaceae bacterium]
MGLTVEIYAIKRIAVRPGSFIRTRLVCRGLTVDGSRGEDVYPSGLTISEGMRLAGLGRPFTFPANAVGCVEAGPGACIQMEEVSGDTALVIENDVVLDQGILTDSLVLRFIGWAGIIYDVPLKRHDIKIQWPERGTFVIPLAGLLTQASE